MSASWLSRITETASFSSTGVAALAITRKMRAISLLAGLPILCIVFHAKSILWSQAAITTFNTSLDVVDDDDDDPTTLQLREEHDQCVICLYNICKAKKYRVLSECSHEFHVDCIDAWLLHNSTCPLCRCSVAFTPAGKKQLPLINSNEEDQEAFYEAVISSILSFLDHFWTWFLNPLGFGPYCQDYHAFI